MGMSRQRAELVASELQVEVDHYRWQARNAKRGPAHDYYSKRADQIAQKISQIMEQAGR